MFISTNEQITPGQVYNSLIKIENLVFIYMTSNFRKGSQKMKDIFTYGPFFGGATVLSKQADQWKMSFENRSRITMIPRLAPDHLICGERADIVLLDAEPTDEDKMWVMPFLSSRGIASDGHLKPRGIYILKD